MSSNPYIDPFYNAMISQYPTAGFDFLSTENRGTGIITAFLNTNDQIVIKGTAYDIFEESIYDIEAWINFALKQGYEEIWLEGHSYGCNKIVYSILQKQFPRIKGLILISPSLTYENVLLKEWEEDHKTAEQEALQLLKEGKANKLLKHRLWGEEILSAQTFVSYFSPSSPANIFKYVSNKDWHYVNKIYLPTLAITGTNDDGIWVDQYKAMEMLERELIKAPKKKTAVFKNADHSFEGFGDKIVEEVLKFIKG